MEAEVAEVGVSGNKLVWSFSPQGASRKWLIFRLFPGRCWEFEERREIFSLRASSFTFSALKHEKRRAQKSHRVPGAEWGSCMEASSGRAPMRMHNHPKTPPHPPTDSDLWPQVFACSPTTFSSVKQSPPSKARHKESSQAAGVFFLPSEDAENDSEVPMSSIRISKFSCWKILLCRNEIVLKQNFSDNFKHKQTVDSLCWCFNMRLMIGQSALSAVVVFRRILKQVAATSCRPAFWIADWPSYCRRLTSESWSTLTKKFKYSTKLTFCSKQKNTLNLFNYYIFNVH